MKEIRQMLGEPVSGLREAEGWNGHEVTRGRSFHRKKTYTQDFHALKKWKDIYCGCQRIRVGDLERACWLQRETGPLV